MFLLRTSSVLFTYANDHIFINISTNGLLSISMVHTALITAYQRNYLPFQTVINTGMMPIMY